MDIQNRREESDQTSFFNSLKDALQEGNSIKAIIDAIGDPLSIQDRSFRILYQNEVHKKLTGGDHAGELCYEAYNNKKSVCPGCPVAMSYTDGQIHTVEKQGSKKNGILSVEITASPLKDNSGSIIAGIEIVRDLTARRKTEEALRIAEEKFRGLVEQSLVGIYIYQNGFFTYSNPRAAEILGYTQAEISAKPFEDFVVPEELAYATNTLQNLLDNSISALHIYLHVKRKDGRIIEIETEGTATEINNEPAVIGTFLDITERRRIEAEAQKIQKLESLSSFAGGIAHEYNNILTAIIGNLALAKMYAKPGYEVYDVMIEAEKASLRAKDLTTQLLSFAKGGTLIKKAVYIQELINSVAGISSLSGTDNCNLTLPDNLWPVEIDEGQIAQALSFLLINARQGAPLQVKADNIQILKSSSLPLMEGRYVVITIESSSDNIPEHLHNVILDPFSTAGEKIGGLGLTNVFSIIKKHDGHITVEASYGYGTAIRIFLPAIQEAEPFKPSTIAMSSSKRGKVLVMDDEEIVRAVINRLLLQCGFESELVTDGSEMLRQYRNAHHTGKPFIAVILDLIIQDGMGGQEAIQHLLDFDPQAKVIVSSGYSNDPIMTNFRKYGFSGFLPKPYKIDELKRVLQDVLASG